jgi:excisionase family DNA binding protein
MGQIVTPEELAKVLKLKSTATVLKLAEQGRIPMISLGRKIRRFDLAEVQKALAASSSSVPQSAAASVT